MSTEPNPADYVMGTSQPYRQARNLTKGRIVIVRLLLDDSTIIERPAIVTRVVSDTAIYAFAFGYAASAEFSHATYSLEPLNNTWCWCDEQDMTKQAE